MTGKAHVYASYSAVLRNAGKVLRVERQTQGARQLICRACGKMEEGNSGWTRKAIQHLIDGSIATGYHEPIHIGTQNASPFHGLTGGRGDERVYFVAPLLQGSRELLYQGLGLAPARDGVAYHQETHLHAILRG